MTPEELKNALIRTELLNSDLATLVGVTTRQVTSWLSGKHHIPRSVAIILRGLDDRKIDRDWLIDTVKNEIEKDLLS